MSYMQKILPSVFAGAENKKVFFSAVFLYFSYCISLTLATKTIGYWMHFESYSYSSITFITSILHLPYSMRIIFTPWLEFIKIPIISTWGHRKTLLFWFNLINIICVLLMSIFGLSNFAIFFLICFVCSISSTSAESITSAYFMSTYRSDLKPIWVQGGQIGYNIALYFTYTLLLAFAVFIPWQWLYASCILFMLANFFVISYIDDCKFERISEPNLQKVYWIPLKDFYIRHKAYFSPLFVFSFFYRAPDKMLAPVLPLLMLDLFGAGLSAILKTISLLAMFIGSFVWKWFKDKHPIDGLISISRIHILNILFLGSMAIFYLYSDYKILALILISISGFMIKLVRTMESAAIFNFQCSMYDNKQFNAQAAMGTLADKAGGDIMASTAGTIKDMFGFGTFFVVSAALVLPAWISGRILQKKQMNLN